MLVDEAEIERVLWRLERLRKAVIDASSIIYIMKSGFYEIVSKAVALTTVPSALAEVGSSGLEIELIQAPNPREDTDRQLYAAAKSLGRALISEDRAILIKCRDAGIEYYNSYMMLLMLRARQVINREQYLGYRSLLIDTSHYGKNVLDYAESFSAYLDKSL